MWNIILIFLVFFKVYNDFSKMRKRHKGEKKRNHQKWVLLRNTCDYPTTSNAYFTGVSEPKLSDDMKAKC